jgi:hypothetical protein
MVLGAALVIGKRKLEVGKDLKAKRLGKKLWAPTVSFIGLVKKIVSLDRGAYPEKLGRWRGFLNRFAVGSFGIQS